MKLLNMKLFLLPIFCLIMIGSVHAHTVNGKTYCTVSHNHHCLWSNKNHRQTILYVKYLDLRKLRVKACKTQGKSACNRAKIKENRALKRYRKLKQKEDASRGTKTVTVQKPPIKRLCPRHTRGDREFAGNGPHVEARASLFTTNGNRQLKVRIYLRAKETKRDWTTASRTWTFPVWSAPYGKRIVSFTPGGVSRARYTDRNHQIDIPSIRGSNLVRRFEIKGDTKGNDVRNCTSDDVYMNVYFQPIRVTYK